MLTYASKFISGDLEPFWPHVALLSLSVLASAAVGAGIIFERPKFSAAVHRIAFWLIVGGVVVEALCTIFLFVFDEGISRRQNEKIIALETQLAPRNLSDEQAALILSGVSAAPKSINAGQVGYAFGASTDEEIGFAIDLSEHVFAKLGWDWKDWPKEAWPTGQVWLPDQRKSVGSLPMNGIEVDSFDPNLSSVEQALIDSLKDAGFGNVRGNAKVDAGLQQSNRQMLILILIGAKPAFKP